MGAQQQCTSAPPHQCSCVCVCVCVCVPRDTRRAATTLCARIGQVHWPHYIALPARHQMARGANFARCPAHLTLGRTTRWRPLEQEGQPRWRRLCNDPPNL